MSSNQVLMSINNLGLTSEIRVETCNTTCRVVVRVRDAKFRSPIVCMARAHPPSGVHHHTGQWVSRLSSRLKRHYLHYHGPSSQICDMSNLQVNLNTANGQVGGIYVTGQLTMTSSTVVIVV